MGVSKGMLSVNLFLRQMFSMVIQPGETIFVGLLFPCPDAFAVHDSGIGQLQANSPVAGPWLSPRKSTPRVVTAIGSDYLVIREDHMLGQRCQGYNWQTVR